MSAFDSNIFGKKSFSDLLQEIHEQQQKRDTQISGLISELKPLISDIGDATLIVPLIKEYLELGIKNDDILVKMATICQRALNSKTGDGDSALLSEEERAQLMAELDNLANPTQEKDGGKD